MGDAMVTYSLDQRREWSEAIPLGDLPVRAAALWPDADAIVFPDERVSFAKLADRVVARARSLRGLGVEAGDKVGILMANSIPYVECALAIASLGGVAVLLNSRYRGSELRYVVADADLRALITSNIVAEHVDHRARLQEAFPELEKSQPGILDLEAAPLLEHVVVIGQDEDQGAFIGESRFANAADSVSAEEVDRLRQQVAIRDVCMMMYTSGTTAQPKGCPMTHEMLVRNSVSAALHRFELTPESRMWDPLPMFHMSAILPLIGTLYCGSAYLGMTYFEPGAALKMMEGEGATHAFPSFPTVTQALVNHPDYPTTDLSSLRLLNNVAPPQTLRKLQEHWEPATQITAYGCTEIGGVACFNEPGDSLELRVTTSGRPFPGIQMRIVDPETGEEVPRGERGEICAKGYSVFEGYYKDEKKTEEAFDSDGWFHTGDIGSMDEDGRISYLGRTKDMLKVGGENVAAAEIEALLMEHPAVAIAQVVGIPDERLVEVPAAFVELAPDATAEPDELLKWTDGKIASFKRPQHMRIVSEWPMSATKIQKFRLRRTLAEELDLELEG